MASQIPDARAKERIERIGSFIGAGAETIKVVHSELSAMSRFGILQPSTFNASIFAGTKLADADMSELTALFAYWEQILGSDEFARTLALFA